jgi:ribonuclease HII
MLNTKLVNTLIDFDGSLSKESDLIVGIDEAGRGALFGPVVAAAVVFKNPEPFIEGVNDSKKVTFIKRKELAKIIKKMAVDYSIGVRNSWYIDKYNIYQSTRMAMIQAIKILKTKPNVYVFDYMTFTGIDGRVYSFPKADSKSFAVACASIIAKTARDDIILKMSKLAKNFSLQNHKGYGTKKHIEELRKFGPSKFHRFSFKRVKE